MCRRLFTILLQWIIFRLIQDSGANISSTTSSKNSRKSCKTYLDKGDGLLYRDVWSIANKLFEIYSSRLDVFIKFKESKINVSRSIDCISKWIINNRKSVGRSDVNDASHPEITHYMVNLPPSSDNTIYILPQKLILWKAYQQWGILDSTEDESHMN